MIWALFPEIAEERLAVVYARIGLKKGGAP